MPAATTRRAADQVAGEAGGDRRPRARQERLGCAFGGPPPGAPATLVWTAGWLELVGGVLLTLGLFARQAALVSSGLMAVAYFIAHAPRGFWPILNGGELAIAYCWLFLYVAAQGPGAWALDNLRRPKR